MINKLLQQNLFQNLFGKLTNLDNNLDNLDNNLDNNNLPDDFDLNKIISQMTSMLSNAEDFKEQINKDMTQIFSYGIFDCIVLKNTFIKNY